MFTYLFIYFYLLLKICFIAMFIICLHCPETYAYSMTFLPIFGNLRKMCALDCGTITFLNEKKSQFLDSLMDKRLRRTSYTGSNREDYLFVMLTG